MSFPHIDPEQYGAGGVTVALVVVLWRVVVTPVLRLIKPQAANDLTDIKAGMEALCIDFKEHRQEVRDEMEKRRQIEIKLFDQTNDLSQRVSHIEGVHSAGGAD